ncbi:MAG: fumarylacetoacetate hydrolase family protein, partial [Acetobacteraceae bacterium]
LLTRRMRDDRQEPHRVSTVKTTSLYWTFAQMVAHHSSAGCNLRSGDLFGTGTISGADQGSFGSLLEITRNGRETLRLPSGEERRFLEDGDEVIFRAHCHRPGYVSIGFGECRGRVVSSA